MFNRLVEIGLLLAVGLAFVIAIALGISLFSPYDPLYYEYVETRDEEVCQNRDAATLVSYWVDPDLKDTIRVIEVTSYWIAEDVPGIPDGTERPAAIGNIEPSVLPEGWYEGTGNLLRVTPNEPGVWRLANDYIVRSTGGPFPPVQTIKVVAENPTTILDFSATSCR